MGQITKINPSCTTIGGISKTIPAEFDNSLSYLEILYKLAGKVNELIDVFNNVLDEKIVEYIDARFNDMIINTMYDAETETLILYLDERDEENQ